MSAIDSPMTGCPISEAIEYIMQDGTMTCRAALNIDASASMTGRRTEKGTASTGMPRLTREPAEAEREGTAKGRGP